jgi:predicted nicotinamide N-methyase
LTPNPALRASLAEQLERLRGDAPDALTDVVVESLDLPGGRLTRLRPRSFDDVREAEALAGPRRPTPYWASAWPAGSALTRAVAAAGDALRGKRVVELGCGIGMPSVAAARAGADVLATDASQEAVVYAAHNLAVNGVEGQVAVATWDDLEALGGPWDLVLAADVLYLQRNAEQLARMLPHVVARGGQAWIADPGRAGCREFLAMVRRNWRRTSTPDRVRPCVEVHQLRRRGSGAT